MEINLDDLLKGKATIIKGKEYLSTEQYINPFLERMQKFTSEFRIQVKLPDQYTLTKNNEINTDDITYNRVWIEAVLPDELNFPNHRESISMIYALDVRKPLVKFFRTGINQACLNLCVFNPNMLEVRELEPESPINFSPLNSIIEQSSDVAMWLHKLENIEVEYSNEILNDMVGRWTRRIIDLPAFDNGFNKVKLPESMSNEAYKLLYKKEESPYYVKPGNSTSMFNVYNAFTELITNDGTINDRRGKDIVNKCEKVLWLKNVLELS